MVGKSQHRRRGAGNDRNVRSRNAANYFGQTQTYSPCHTGQNGCCWHKAHSFVECLPPSLDRFSHRLLVQTSHCGFCYNPCPHPASSNADPSCLTLLRHSRRSPRFASSPKLINKRNNYDNHGSFSSGPYQTFSCYETSGLKDTIYTGFART